MLEQMLERLEYIAIAFTGFYCKQVAQASDMVDSNDLLRWFDNIIMPTVQKSQRTVSYNSVGNYLVVFARVSSISEVQHELHTHT